MVKKEAIIKTYQVYEDPQIVAGFWKKTREFLWRRQLDNFISLLGVKGRVLDLGCGPGRDSRYLAERGLKVVGIDYSTAMVRLAKKLHGHIKNIYFKKMDMRNLNFIDGGFNGVWAQASLLHIPKKEIPQVLREVWRVLKPGGYFFVAVKQGEGEKVVASNKYGKAMERFFSFFQPNELREFLLNVSFEVKKERVEKFKDTYWVQILAKKTIK